MGPKWFEALRSLRETQSNEIIGGSVKKLRSSLNKELTENGLNKDVKRAVKSVFSRWIRSEPLDRTLLSRNDRVHEHISV